MTKYSRLENGSIVEDVNGTEDLLTLVRVGDIIEINITTSPNNMVYMYNEDAIKDLQRHTDIISAYWFKLDNETYSRYT
jgi:hypothetical protein